jgi:hypothetical protein
MSCSGINKNAIGDETDDEFLRPTARDDRNCDSPSVSSVGTYQLGEATPA